MYELKLVPFERWHAGAIAPDMKEEDVRDLAENGRTPLAGLLACVNASDTVGTFTLDGKPFSVIGAVEPLLGNSAVVWELGTDSIRKVPVASVKYGRAFVKDILSRYEKAFNFTDTRNTRTLRWLKALGYELESETVNGRECVRLTARR